MTGLIFFRSVQVQRINDAGPECGVGFVMNVCFRLFLGLYLDWRNYERVLGGETEDGLILRIIR